MPVASAVEPTAEWAAIERFEPGRSNVVVTTLSCVAALGEFLFGYDSWVINGAGGSDRNVRAGTAIDSRQRDEWALERFRRVLAAALQLNGGIKQ